MDWVPETRVSGVGYRVVPETRVSGFRSAARGEMGIMKAIAQVEQQSFSSFFTKCVLFLMIIQSDGERRRRHCETLKNHQQCADVCYAIFTPSLHRSRLNKGCSLYTSL